MKDADAKDGDAKDSGVSDAGGSKNGDSKRKPTFGLPAADTFISFDFGFDMSLVLGMIAELGEEEDEAVGLVTRSMTPDQVRTHSPQSYILPKPQR